jgi:hypothetical protein
MSLDDLRRRMPELRKREHAISAELQRVPTGVNRDSQGAPKERV